MVRKEGKENGKGAEEIENINSVELKIKSLFTEYCAKFNYIEDSNDISIEEVLIVGSYGNKDGLPDKSDLDVIILTWYEGNIKSNDYSQWMEEFSSFIQANEDKILSDINSVDKIDSYVFPYFERQKHLAKLAKHESVKKYYNLTENQYYSYYDY